MENMQEVERLAKSEKVTKELDDGPIENEKGELEIEKQKSKEVFE